MRGFGRARLQEFRVEVAGARSAYDHDRRICAAGRGDGRRDFRPIAAAHRTAAAVDDAVAPQQFFQPVPDGVRRCLLGRIIP